MKAIHAYVRRDLAEHVIAALVEAGCHTFSVLEVQGITHDVASVTLDYSVSLAQRVEHVIKIEVIANDADAARWAPIISRAAHTGHPGDGLVSVLPVDSAIHISTKQEGDQALENG